MCLSHRTAGPGSPWLGAVRMGSPVRVEVMEDQALVREALAARTRADVALLDAQRPGGAIRLCYPETRCLLLTTVA